MQQGRSFVFMYISFYLDAIRIGTSRMDCDRFWHYSSYGWDMDGSPEEKYSQHLSYKKSCRENYFYYLTEFCSWVCTTLSLSKSVSIAAVVLTICRVAFIRIGLCND